MSTYLLSAASVWGKVWPLLAAVLYFGFLILSHEVGHFSAAKAFKVKVREFAMGMGPVLFKFGKGETKYALRALPFGGSVLMDEDEENSDEPRAFTNQKPWKRVVILASGAVVNLIVGLLIMAVFVASQPDAITTKISYFGKDALTQAQGLQEGDTIYKINGRRVYTYIDISFLISRSEDCVVDLVVKRGGEKIKFDQFAFYGDVQEDGTLLYRHDFALTVLPKSFGRIMSGTVNQSVTVARIVYMSLGDMITGKFRLSDISGPIGVVNVITDRAKEAQSEAGKPDKSGFYEALLNLMFLLALISINIGIMNLLPLPALDGGRLVFCFIEMIFRKPVPKRVEAWIHGIGITLLLLFMFVITASDIWGLIKR
ncbi:MAG: M50 family metallopeptidase [Oscillospiraceae bacterium]|nr:M50 family metallopeptidase [Oscillospiraceae bacterium]